MLCSEPGMSFMLEQLIKPTALWKFPAFEASTSEAFRCSRPCRRAEAVPLSVLLSPSGAGFDPA